MSDPTRCLAEWPDEVPQPHVKARCKTCYRAFGNRWPDAPQVVSPSDVEHISEAYGVTLCGRDGTGNGWWWPL